VAGARRRRPNRRLAEARHDAVGDDGDDPRICLQGAQAAGGTVPAKPLAACAYVNWRSQAVRAGDRGGDHAGTQFDDVLARTGFARLEPVGNLAAASRRQRPAAPRPAALLPMLGRAT